MKYLKSFFVFCLTFIILFSMCHNVFATNENEISISSKEGIGNTIEIISGNSNNIKSESVVDVVNYLLTQGIIVNSINDSKENDVELDSTVLIGTGYVLETNNGNYSVIVYGDANGDGEVDAGDMKVIIDNFLGTKQASLIEKIAVDLYKDGDLDAADLKQVLDSFLGNLTGSILKISNTPTPDVSVTPVPTPTTIPSSWPKINVGAETITLTPETAPDYYGKVITNYSVDTPVTWRLFYVDFNGKYGAEGKIYLKADQAYTKNAHNYGSSTNLDSGVFLMKKMNPDFAKRDGRVTSYDYGTLMYRPTLYLCWSSKWSSWADTNKADYAIAVPSIEMYLDSYNAYHTRKGTAGYEPISCKWFFPSSASSGTTSSHSGYKYTVGKSNSNYEVATAVNTLKADENNMYVKDGQTWWLCSPSSQNGENYLCAVNGSRLCLSYGYHYSDVLGYCPLVSLKSNFIPSITN